MSKSFIIVVAAITAVVLAVGIPNFIKAHQISAANYYVNNLRQLDAAKNQWALEKNKMPNDLPPRWAELSIYLPSWFTNCCATNGVVIGSKGEIYTIGRVGQPSSCFVDGQIVYSD